MQPDKRGGCDIVRAECVLSYCKYGVCSYISSCFPPPIPLDLCKQAEGCMSSWRPLWGTALLPIVAE